MVLKLPCAPEPQKGWLKDPRPAPKVSDPRGLGEELIVCISNKFLCYADAAGLGATLNITEVGISVLSTLEVRKWAQ